jgi:hypothetical protein
MKNLVKTVVSFAYGAKVHSTHTAIKGRKSGGTRDSTGVDWKNQSLSGEADRQN